VDEIASIVAAGYDVPLSLARADVDEMVEILAAKRLLAAQELAPEPEPERPEATTHV
jgi:hypothetical protein